MTLTLEEKLDRAIAFIKRIEQIDKTSYDSTSLGELVDDLSENAWHILADLT